jgi:hypothetical protein
VTEQPIPQVDPAQVLQTLLNQLAIPSQLNLQQSTPSDGQQIRQTPHVANTQGSSGARTSMVPNPQSRILEERPPKTPTEIHAIEQVSAELKSHIKQEWIDHFLKMLQKQYGIKPKQ